jgi:hypothetical protein
MRSPGRSEQEMLRRMLRLIMLIGSIIVIWYLLRAFVWGGAIVFG